MVNLSRFILTLLRLIHKIHCFSCKVVRIMTEDISWWQIEVYSDFLPTILIMKLLIFCHLESILLFRRLMMASCG